MEPNKILKSDMLDILFEDRNKEYGAYHLRKTYNKRIRNALIITASIAVLALLGSLLANQLNKGPKVKISDELTIENIEQKEEKKEEIKLDENSLKSRGNFKNYKSDSKIIPQTTTKKEEEK